MSNPRIEIPAPPGKSYLPYQLKGIRYALGASGTLIADEMGLGKTVQAIGVINATRPMRVVVICPAGLILNWKNELDDWLIPVPGQHVFAVSYHKAEQFAEDHGVSIDLLIVDEAHYIKNANSKRAKLVQVIAQHSKRVLLLTGTPMENRPVELWPLLQIVCPEEWDPPNRQSNVISAEQRVSHPGEGPNFWAFAKRYCGLKKTSFKTRHGYKSAYDFSGASNLEELNARLKGTCMLRRLKKDVLPELPSKRRQLILLKSKDPASNLLPELNEDNYYDAIERLTSDKVLFEEYSKRRHEQALEKVDQCISFIEDALDSSAKIVVFGHHQDVIDMLYTAIEFSNPGIAVRVTGKTHVADRGAAVVRFQTSDGCRLFIGSIGAAGVGITLTAASHIIFVELDPVPGRMTQAEDRCHRIGQKDMVLVQHLLSNHSLCARIAKILVKKQEVLDVALDGT